MVTKQISLPLETEEERIEFMCRVLDITSPIDLIVMKSVYAVSKDGPALLENYERKIICLRNKINVNSFNVSLMRLIQRGAIIRGGKMFTVADFFKEIHKCDKLSVIWKK